MKCYILERLSDGTLKLTCQALVKGKVVEVFPAGPFDIGNSSKDTKALALTILLHYYGTDAGGQAEAERKQQPFLEALLLTHSLPPGAKLEIPSDVIDRFMFLLQAMPVQVSHK